ncbi:tRNA (adenosine(37)-N6)-dimethylallyltransferase MiaA [Candidatus Parcubacteria bacterium]|jgi:tRNA dimethylallyltransferase|nr:MAG: tRNA (adenosine(37)-N6)-dimethylallyltransferase MiaA [Candidatus Parcubacteria bacterium]
MPKKTVKVIALVGPNAAGKSAWGVRIAKLVGGEIISADSRQVYKNLNIGSGKITKSQMGGIPHHLLDVAHPKKLFTVTDFQKIAQAKIQDINYRRKIPIVVGGTGFWLDALLYGWQIPHIKPNFKLRRKLSRWSTEKLFASLKKLDPGRAKNIDKQNPIRLVRALEIVLASKKSVPRLRQSQPYKVLWVGIQTNKPALKKKIQKRLKQRIRAGMISEVKGLLRQGVPAKRLLALGLEYRFVTLFLQKKITRTEMESRLSYAIWHYAKRQITWFKRNPNIHWLKNFRQAQVLVRRFLTSDQKI